MLSIRSLFMGVIASAALFATATNASADGAPCNGLFCNQLPYPHYYTFGAFAGHGQKPLPMYQAAPWYLYWPYDGHFMTPAPVTGAFYGPPVPGNFPVNPYFPGQSYGYGYAPIPGGAAPMPGMPTMAGPPPAPGGAPVPVPVPPRQ